MKIFAPFKFYNNDCVWLLFALTLGALVRLLFVLCSGVALDGDEAIVGLMAKHIEAGEPIPIFYYGQHYMGSLEAILVSFSFHFLGVSTFSLKLVPFLTSLLLIVVMYVLGRTVYNSLAGRIAAILTAFSPYMLIVWSIKARGGFIEVILIGALAFLALLKWLKTPTKKRTLWIGFLLGLGWWVNNQVIYFMLPVALWMLLRLKSSWRLELQHFLCGLIAFFVGGLPFWIYNFQHDFVTFKMFGTAGSKGIWQNLQGLFSNALPIIIGAKKDWSLTLVFPSAETMAWSGVAFCTLFYCIWRRKEILHLFVGKLDLEHPLELFAVFVLSVLFIYSVSSFGAFTKEPRYLLPIYVGGIVLVAVILARIMRFSRLVGLAFLLTVLIFNQSSQKAGIQVKEPEVFEGERVSTDQSEIIKLLQEKQITFIRTDYWIGYRLAFESNEQIKFLTFDDPIQDRIPSYIEQASQLDKKNIPLLVVPKQAKLIREAYKTLGVTYKEATASGYILFYDLEQSFADLELVSSSEVSVEANVNNSVSALAIDGDPNTRWASAEPQKPLMRFLVTFKEPQTLQGLSYLLANWPHDFPRELRIELEAPTGQRIVLIEPQFYTAVKYLGTDEFSFRFAPFLTKRIYFVQEGQDPVFDWSIAELNFYK